MDNLQVKNLKDIDIINLLSKVTVLNRDNKSRFTVTDRLDVISELLWNSQYRRINADGLFHLYSKVPLEKLTGKSVVVVSSHVDCENSITKCFSEKLNDDMLLGTYDNAITNTSAIFTMISGGLPDNVVFAFTGDEEYGSAGANQVAEFLKKNNIFVYHIFVLDVTDMAWDAEADFTIENDFWDDKTGKGIVEIVEQLPYRWRFVPEDSDSIPDYIDSCSAIYEEAEEDESWLYDELGLECCSFCLPVLGEMHSNAGVKARIISFERYTKTLYELLKELGNQNTK